MFKHDSVSAQNHGGHGIPFNRQYLHNLLWDFQLIYII